MSATSAISLETSKRGPAAAGGVAKLKKLTVLNVNPEIMRAKSAWPASSIQVRSAAFTRANAPQGSFDRAAEDSFGGARH